MMVYKYLSIERFDVLQNEKIRCTQHQSLNDPFEGNFKSLLELSVNDVLENDPDHISPVQKKDLNQHLDDNNQGKNELYDILNQHYGILSTSLCYDNILMWSHYASNHQGFVIGINEHHDVFKECIPSNKAGDFYRQNFT
ncbi:DUF2971 domain-containing protein [Fibrobacterota bacterium]